ncbi:hypothetical protein VTK73DRAFT_6235 [Phialemonium thermophilum]|uniref:Pseudouridine synthase I TruA alpha/beta domain-containing protein n=1 Tax=Phialemonium thermophilum TaxID=223376 RepID=A0ABR3WK84_9PEZI
MTSDASPTTTAGQAPDPVSEQAAPQRSDGQSSGQRHRDKAKSHGEKRKRGGGFGSHKHDRPDKREQVRAGREEKRRKILEADGGKGSSYMSINFSPEEIAAEERRPKRKVAVMIGYAGTGYSGLQMNHTEKTIEGDLFAAFVAAGAIAKANADDPKKSSFVRCARTDKGVHAAGNVLSLKLIIEDPDLVGKINSHLPPQIRVWGIQRTNNGFSCYQACDSRWYEYLMPSYALLPPRPDSFLGRKVIESARDKGVYEEYMGRLDDVKGFWEEVDRTVIQPILDRLSGDVRSKVVSAIQGMQTQDPNEEDATTNNIEHTTTSQSSPVDPTAGAPQDPQSAEGAGQPSDPTSGDAGATPAKETTGEAAATDPEQKATSTAPSPSPFEAAMREIKAALVATKRRYRVTPERLGKLQQALNLYLGTHNFHNYTVLKSVSDPSAKRHIKSFVVDPTPIQIRDTEWLSIKVHGQSFMMHQIRKMIAMAVMVTRCGAPLDIITQSYGPRRISIPKAPGLGLMLERPIFDEYNKRATGELGREPIDFSKYEDQIREFKDREIYSRMFEVEEKENSFHTFFNQLDNFRTDYFLWVTAGGLEASHERTDRGVDKIPKALEAELGDEADGVEETQ